MAHLSTAMGSGGALLRHTALATSLAFALMGCTTPVLHPSVEVPGRFAAAPTTNDEPEAAWWDSFADPVLSDLVRRAARENRDIKIAVERVRAARAGETISRSWLLPSLGVSGGGFDHRTGYNSATSKSCPRRRTRRGRRAVLTPVGRLTWPVACGQAPRRRRPTGWQQNTLRGVFVCWW